MTDRIWLSPPHMGPNERALLLDAFDSNWVAPLGPHVDAFQTEFARYIGGGHCVALSSGTGALHLALTVLGIKPGDTVAVSSLTFAATVNPVRYMGAIPVLLDSEPRSWNMDPALLETFLSGAATKGALPKAIVVVHIYGQTADMDAIFEAANRYDIPVIEDAAESLGADYRGRPSGRLGRIGLFSFNGNKVITTSGGGMLVSDDKELMQHALKLATQARDPAPHYEHTEIGFNYRMSNLLAAVGRGQLQVIEDRIAARRANYAQYAKAFADVAGITFQPDAGWGRHTRWLTAVLVDPAQFGATREDVRLALHAENIEARPLWKPMHMQPVFSGFQALANGVSEALFHNGLCLPSGSALTPEQIDRVVNVVLNTRRA